MEQKFKTFKQRLSAVYDLMRLATDKRSISVMTGLYNSVSVVVFNENSEVMAKETFADYCSEELMAIGYQNLANIMNPNNQ